MSITDQESSLKVSLLGSKDLFLSDNVHAIVRREYVYPTGELHVQFALISPYDSQTDQEQSSGSVLVSLSLPGDGSSSQGCIIQISPLCFSDVTCPWGGTVATPNTPVLCYKTSEPGIPLSS